MVNETAQEYIGPQLEPEKFLKEHSRLASEEASAASDAGERRQEIGQLFEGMRLENKAASQARAILKIKNDGKRRDAVRTWQQLLPMLEAEILGETEDMFPSNGGPDIEEGVQEPDRDASEGELADEEAEFNDAVDDVVTPINLGAAE